MAGIEFYDSAPEGRVYRPEDFEGAAGRVVPVRFRPSGKKIGEATVLSVDADEGGVIVAVEVDGKSPLLPPVRNGQPGFSFRFRPPGDEVGVVAARDPLPGRPPRARGRR